MPIVRFPRPHSEKPLTGGKHPQAKNGNIKGGKGGKRKGGGKKGESPEQTPPKDRYSTPASSKYIGKRYVPNYHNRPKAHGKGKGKGY